MAIDAITLDCAVIDFRLDVQLLENALGTGNAFLDGRTDFRKLPDRLRQQTRSGDVGHQITGGGVAAQEQHEEHQHGHGGVDHQLQHGRIDRSGFGHAQLLVGVALAGGGKALFFVALATEAAHYAIALNGLGSYVRHVAHGHLDLLALLAEFLAGVAHHERNQRQDGQHHQGQLPVHPQQIGKQEDHGQAFADHHLDGIRGRTGHHRHVERDARDQVPGVVGVEVAIGQHQQLVEQLDAQVMHQPQRYLRQVVVTEERAQALPRRDQDDQQRHGHQQLQILQVRNRGEEHRFRIAQAIDEILENPGQHWLCGGKDHEAHDTQQEKADIGFYITQEPKIDFQAGILSRFRRCVSHRRAHWLGRTRNFITGVGIGPRPHQKTGQPHG
ncbi:hypothetical protein D3C85_501270 [compost metagenome]